MRSRVLGWLRGLGRVDYEVPPQEPACLSASSPKIEAVEAAICGIDIRLRELFAVPLSACTAEQDDEIQRLLARRRRLVSPEVPVIPGRSS